MGEHERARGRGERRGRGVAFGLSVAVHAVLAVILLWRHPAPAPRQATAIEIELVTPSRDRAPAAGPGTTRPARARSSRPPAPPLTPSPPVTVPLPAPPLAPLDVSPPADPAASNLRRALRGAMGCGHADLMGLSPAEKQRCRERQARALEPRPGQPGFGMDPRKRAAFAAEAKEREPFLIQTPKDNCVPRVAQKDVGMGSGATHDWTMGINCAKSF